MMKCGHAANATTADNKPVCVICIGIVAGADQIEEKPPDLNNRFAECECKNKRKSSLELAFFEYRPNKETDSFYCGCRGWD